MSEVAMTCGHTAQGTRHNREDGTTQPVCVICDCVEVDDSPPDLTGRTARCGYGCGAERPSSRSLPFFEYRGPGSMDHKCRNCGYHEVAHEGGKNWRPNGNACDDFQARTEGFENDGFYCGCRGWD